MEIKAADVMKLRKMTGAGMMDCKKALIEAEGDFARAQDIIREKGKLIVAKRADRTATEGVVVTKIVGQKAYLLCLACETDFVAKTDEFKAFCRDIAMQIAAASPEYVRREEVPEHVLERERHIARQQAINDGKPEKILDKIVEGRIEKFYKEVCLMEQVYIKDNDLTVDKYLTSKIAKIGENISIRRFARFVVGEGIEKKESNLAEEVAAMQGGQN